MEKLPAPNIIWSAGENSGDFLASEVLPSVMQEFPEIEMDGIGGDLSLIHISEPTRQYS